MTANEFREEVIKILERKAQEHREYWKWNKGKGHNEVASECLGRMLGVKEAITVITNYPGD